VPQLIVYGLAPTPLDTVAAVEHNADPVTSLVATVSPLAKPVIDAVSVGLADPYLFDASFAMTFNKAGVTVS
jgi:hypothetical protein